MQDRRSPIGLVEITTPCNNTTYIPAKIELLRTQGKFSIFITHIIESDTLYLCATHPNGYKFFKQENFLQAGALYKAAMWDEEIIKDSFGIFSYKIAESLDYLNDFIENMQIVDP